MDSKEIAVSMSIKLCWDLLFDRDSSDDDEDNEHNPKNLLYYENTICAFNDQQFKAHFRMLPSTVEMLYQSLVYLDSKYVDVSRGHPRITLEKQILVTIWYLANNECFRSVSGKFGISINACWNLVFHISKNILQLNHNTKIIAWPSQQRALETSDYFRNKTTFPGIIGCIDGSHISIPAPKLHPNSYINRKKFHSVLLQGVCDEKMAFIDCYAGTPRISEDQHLVGDLGYGLKPYLLTPFKDTENLTDRHRIYNKAHSSARVTIERAFGLLKGRFRRLIGLNTRRPDLIPLLIMTACILHNVCLQNADNLDNFIVSNDDGTKFL